MHRNAFIRRRTSINTSFWYRWALERTFCFANCATWWTSLNGHRSRMREWRPRRWRRPLKFWKSPARKSTWIRRRPRRLYAIKEAEQRPCSPWWLLFWKKRLRRPRSRESSSDWCSSIRARSSSGWSPRRSRDAWSTPLTLASRRTWDGCCRWAFSIVFIFIISSRYFIYSSRALRSKKIFILLFFLVYYLL